MIDLIRLYVALLTRDSIDAEGIVEVVGRPTADRGIPMPIAIAPFSPELRAASLGRYRETGLPFVLMLEPVPDRRPALAALVAAFGPCTRVPTGRGMRASWIIDPAGCGDAWSVALVVTLAEADVTGGEPMLAEISLRRDPIAVRSHVADSVSP